MYYLDVIEKLLTLEQNVTNRMYINEIKIKWRKFLSAVDASENDENLDKIVETFSEFTKTIMDNKYKWDPDQNKGFKKDDEIFKPIFLDDLISYCISKLPILNSPGIKFGYQKFHKNLRLKPIINCQNVEPEKMFDPQESPEFLQITQELDFQYSIKDDDSIIKHTIRLPLIIFHTFQTLREEDFILADYYAKLAKNANFDVKYIVVALNLEPDFKPNLRLSAISSIVILRDQPENVIDKPEIDQNILVEFFNDLNNCFSNNTNSQDFSKATIIT